MLKFLHSRLRARALNRAVACTLITALTLPVNTQVSAANHPLTAVPDVNTVDYVLNVDWDFDSPPTHVLNSSEVLNRAYIERVVRVFAQSLFTMTEGRHRVGNVFVYRNKQFGNNVDIQLLNTQGRSAANVSGWGKRNESTFNHLAFSGAPESVNALGKVVAHELGHYTYGLYDEYVEAGSPLNPQDPGAPSGVDNAKNSIMNDHLSFVSLSTPADYADATQRQTAQARVMATGGNLAGGSAWEMLTRTPDQDPVATRSQGRTFFEAFRGIDPASLQLTRPVNGYDARLNLIFQPAPVFRDVIVVDRTLPPARFAALIQGAKAMVSQAPANTQYAVVTSPPLGTGPVLGYTPASIEGKESLNSALDSLQPNTAGTFDALAAFTQAFQLMAGARQAGDPAAIHLLTGAETSVPVEAANTARSARISVNPLGLTGADSQQRQARAERARRQSVSNQAVNLAELARQTGGSYNIAKDGEDAAKDTVRAVKEAHSAAYAVLAWDGSEALPAGGQFTSRFNMASGTTDGTVSVAVVFNPAEASRLSFSLTAPNGQAYTPSTLPAGITFTNDESEGYAEFLVAPTFPGRTGQWTLTARASAAVADGVLMEVASDTLLALSGVVEGGNAGATTAPVLRVKLGSEKNIRGAVVTADIYSETDELVLSNVVLRDDGVSPDTRANDGLYAVSLANRLPAGEYFAILSAQTTADSRIASLGALIRGARDEELPVESLTRLTEVAFSLDASAAGVGTGTGSGTTTPPATDSGGGCTTSPTGRDGGLLLLLLGALLGLALRRRPIPVKTS